MSVPVSEHDDLADEDLRVRRAPERASHDAAAVSAIIDAAMVAHVGTVRDGRPVVIPMFHARDGDALLLHGSPSAGTFRRSGATDVCVEITVVDEAVLARSAFHHSLNYRSVVILGTAEPIEELSERAAALDRFVERLVPGRSTALRPSTDKELRSTHVLRVPLRRASAKIRAGAPRDDAEDLDADVWAGVVPLFVSAGEGEPHAPTASRPTPRVVPLR